MESSSRSIRLRPSWPPSVVATRLATGMNSADAGIFSSARLRFAMFLPLLLQVRARALHPAGCGRLELFALALGGRHAVLDRFADRVLRVRHDRPRALRRVAGTLYRLASAQLDRFRAQALDLLPTGSGRDVGADREPDEPAKDEPAETTAAAVSVVSHRRNLL